MPRQAKLNSFFTGRIFCLLFCFTLLGVLHFHTSNNITTSHPAPPLKLTVTNATYTAERSPDYRTYCNEHISKGLEGTLDLEGYSLESVQVITRHGDRSNSHHFLTWEERVFLQYHTPFTCGMTGNDLYEWQKAEQSFEVRTFDGMLQYMALSSPLKHCHDGQLTPRGFNQMFRLGYNLRKSYRDFFPAKFDSSFVQVISTDVGRTIRSAFAFLRGLLKDKELSKSKVTIWKTIRNQNEFVRPTWKYPNSSLYYCPKAKQMRQEWKTDPANMEEKSLHRNRLLRRLSYIFQNPTLNEQKITSLTEIVYAYHCHNFPLPCVADCISPDLEHDMRESSDFVISNLNSGPKIKLAMYPFLSKLGNSMKEISNLEDPLMGFDRQQRGRFQLYSGHDSVISAVLGALGVPHKSWPPYASRIALELWKKHEQFYVRALYQGKVITHKIPSCQSSFNSELCPLSSFLLQIESALGTAQTYKEACMSSVV